VIAIHSTISAGTAIELAELARAQGVHLIDAPVSGGFMGAHAGTLATMVGGTDEAVALARPSLGRWAQLIVHLGPVGAGTRAKIARNLLHFTAFTAASEAQRLAEAAGVDLRKLAKVVRHTDAITGGAGSIMLRDTTSPMTPDDDWWDTLTHVRRLGEKDLDLALELGRELDVDLPLGRVARQRFGPGLGFADGEEEAG
jgi:3-hydroxyisobutyrate dehydrogenase-like beta-hydroxyacid dehydrogenase